MAPAPGLPPRSHARMVLPERLAKLTGRTASAAGAVSRATLAGRVMTRPDQLAALASAPDPSTRSTNRDRACTIVFSRGRELALETCRRGIVRQTPTAESRS